MLGKGIKNALCVEGQPPTTSLCVWPVHRMGSTHTWYKMEVHEGAIQLKLSSTEAEQHLQTTWISAPTIPGTRVLADMASRSATFRTEVQNEKAQAASLQEILHSDGRFFSSLCFIL